MRKRKKLGLLAMVAAVFAGAGGVAQAEIVIDSFEFGDHSVFDNNVIGNGDSDTYIHANKLDDGLFGWTRELHVTRNTPGSGFILLTSDGAAAYSAQDQTSAPDLIYPDVAHITWDGVGNAEGGDPSYNNGPFSSLLLDPILGNNAFQLTSNTTISASRFAAIQVWDTNGDTDAVTFELLSGVDKHNVSFLSFSNLIDFGSIGAIRLHFLTDDTSFSQFTIQSGITNFAPVVPVPAAAWMGFLGMGLIAARRRKQGAKAA